MAIKQSMIVLAAVLAMTAGTAQAAGPTGYFGGGLGNTRAPDLQSSACSQLNDYFDPGFACDVDDSKAAFKLFGGAQFNDYLAAEGTLVYLGNFEGTATGTAGGIPDRLHFRYEASGLAGDLVGTLPLGQEFALLGRVGAFFWSVRDIWDDVDNGVSLDYGAGVEVNFNRNIGLRAEYVTYKDIGTFNTGKSDLNLTSLSLIYRFR